LRVSQPEKVIQKFRQVIEKYDNFKLAAFEKAVLRTKSFMIGLALIERAISVEFATAAARVEVQQQINKWGEVEDNHDLDREEMKVQLGASIIAVIDESNANA
jgi:ATP synthase mitochondrial F1 complex assembly factor 2